MDKELIENIANALAVSEICPFAHEDCIDNCHKHFSNWLDNHDKQIRADEIEEFAEAYKNFMNEPGCNIHENCIDGDCIDCFKDEWLKGARK